MDQKIIKIDNKIFDSQTVLQAAAFFLPEVYVDLKNEENILNVSFEFKENLPDQEKDRIVKEFKNELVYQRLRNIVSENNREIRELIVGKALIGADPAVVKDFEKVLNGTGAPDNPLDAL